jgi:hypothetical protein
MNEKIPLFSMILYLKTHINIMKITQNKLIYLVFSEYRPGKNRLFKIVFQHLYNICNTNQVIYTEK